MLDHSASQRSNNRRIQADSFIYIGQARSCRRATGTRGRTWWPSRPSKVSSSISRWCAAPRRRSAWTTRCARRAAGAHYLLYCRFARGDNRIGNWEEWEDEEELGRVGRDRSVIQVMLIETSTRFLVDSATIRSRGGFLTFYDATPEDLLRPPLEQYAQELLGLNSRGTGYE